MADASTNKTAAETTIQEMYPEIADIETKLDAMAAKGRQYYVIEVFTEEHALPVKNKLDTDLAGKNYVITISNKLITISWKS